MILHEMLSSLDNRLLAIGRCRVGREWNYRNVNNYYNRLLLVMGGSTTVAHQGQEYQLEGGSIHLIPCYTAADYICKSGEFDMYYLHFTSRALGGLDLCRIQEYTYQRAAREIDYSSFGDLHRLNPNWALPVVDPSINLYRLYHDEHKKDYHQLSAQRLLENMAYISLLLAPFLATGVGIRSDQSESRRLHAFIVYVEENLHRSLGLQEIADALAISPNYLSDWLYKILRVRPVEYINRRRIEEAQRRLVSNDTSIHNIADELGFSSATYFARLFKEQMGISASSYRSLYT